jgi:hypothetical protein
MDNRQADVAWRTFNFNWLFVLLLGVSLVCIGASMGFSLEPIAFGVTLFIALLLAIIAYSCAFARHDSADPKVVFWLGSTAQIILVSALAVNRRSNLTPDRRPILTPLSVLVWG